MPQIHFNRMPDELDVEMMKFIDKQPNRTSSIYEMYAMSKDWRRMGRTVRLPYKNTLVKRLARLVEAGLVRKRPKVGRKIPISLTPKGRLLLGELMGVIRESFGIQTLNVPAGTDSLTVSTMAPLSVQHGADWVDIQIGSTRMPLSGEEVHIRFLDVGTEHNTPRFARVWINKEATDSDSRRARILIGFEHLPLS